MIQLRRSDGRERLYSAERLLALGFLSVILVGTALLELPAATVDGRGIGLFDSLFTATSAVCVTGLVAVDTGTTFSPFGQAVLLVLIQVGGLGFMMFATMIMVMLGRKISLKGRMLIRESMNGASLTGLSGLARLYLMMALLIELAGAAVLAARFIPMYGPRRGAWMAVFHAVSAFCNAGFDLFGNYASLTAFDRDPLVLLTVATLIVLGGLGFSVILEALRNRQGFKGLSLHARIVFMLTPVLLCTGTGIYLLAEGGGALAGYGFGDRVLNAFFQSATMRTAGFNSIDLSGMKDGSKLFSSLLMMIGASPASTGGGMKTTTVAVFALLMLSVVKGEGEVNIARRRLSDDLAWRALAVVALFISTLTLGALAISLIEGDGFALADVLFEAASAMGTVGVSSIGTPNLHAASRAVLLPMMFLGRIGPLTLAMAVAKRQGGNRRISKYPEEKIMIG